MREKLEEILVVYMPIIIFWAYAIIYILILIGIVFLILF